MDTPAFDQDIHHGRLDDGSETGATFIGAAGSDWSQAVSTTFRCRFVIQETAGFAATNFRPDLRYELNGTGGFIAISDTSAVVRARLSDEYADGDDTTQQVGSGTFITDNNGMVEFSGVGNSVDFVGSDEMECEYALMIVAADVNDADTIVLRVFNKASALDTYTDEPTITVDKGAPFEPGILRTSFNHLLRM